MLPFAHGLAPPLFAPPSRKDPGSVDLSISSRNSPSFLNSGQISPANLVLEKINRWVSGLQVVLAILLILLFQIANLISIAQTNNSFSLL